MISNFFVATGAVIPIFILISIGLLIRKMQLLTDTELNHVNRMVFRVFFAIMMFYNVYHADFTVPIHLSLLVFAGTGVLAMCALFTAIIVAIEPSNKRRGAMSQAIWRSNFVLLGIPIVANIFGDDQVVVPTVLISVVIPIYNVMSVIILEYFHGGDVHPGKLIIDVLTTPLISGAICGSIFLLLHIPVPTCILNPVSKLSSLATPIAIITLGGTLHFNAIGKNLRYLVPVLLARLVFIPPIAVFVAHALGFSQVETFIVLILFATPVAAASYPMARNLGGDGELSGQLVVLSTVLSVGTIFCWIVLLRTIGII